MYGTKPPTPSKRSSPSKLDEELRCEVGPDDLRHLDTVHAILRLLNEPRQSAAPLVQLIERVPVLSARLRLAHRPPQWCTESVYGEAGLRAVLVALGNRGFEAILLEYLEDLTVLRASLEEKG